MTDVDLHKVGLGKMTDSEKVNYMQTCQFLGGVIDFQTY